MWLKTYNGTIYEFSHKYKDVYVCYTGERDIITGRRCVQWIDYTIVEKVAETKEELL